MELTTLTGGFLKDNCASTDSVSKRDGIFTFKMYYFYRMGMTPQKYETKVLADLLRLGIRNVAVISSEEHWNAWPKDSWFEVKLRIKE